LLYFNPDEAATFKTIREFNLYPGSTIPASGAGNILSIGQGDDGELYVMFANGDVKQIAQAPLVGDYNNDNVVDAADYVVWRENFNSSTANLPNDLTPSLVDASDYDAWKAHFGNNRSLIAAADGEGPSSSVPEAGAIPMLVLGSAGSLLRRRRTACRMISATQLPKGLRQAARL
jgi:hypothetical protein